MQKWIIIPALLAVTTFSGISAQRPYWQQQVDYTIDVNLDVKKHIYGGSEKVIYTNNSPDTLKKVYFHLYYNAFQPRSSMDLRNRLLPDAAFNRITQEIYKLKPKEQGVYSFVTLRQNGKDVGALIEGTILEINLNTPILPGGKSTFEMTFACQIPKLLERGGWMNAEGVDYNMSQWYPKMCEYDEEGWHADPYIGREFYGVFGNFDVTITLDKKYVVGGTGVLQNPQEIGKGYEDPSKELAVPKSKMLSWHFKAENVHDFVWAADPDYLHDKVQANDSLVMHFLYLKKADGARWKSLQPYMVKMFDELSKRVGTYPYPQFSFIQGGDGGMEYPMATLVMDDGDFDDLLDVCIHEAIHNWFYGVLANNESKYPFLDEGFTTWMSFQMEDFLRGVDNEHSAKPAFGDYTWLVTQEIYEPLATHSDFYKTATAYEISAYYAGTVFLDQLQYILGRDAFNTGLRRYFSEWKFKHPRPADFLRSMEKASGLELDWYGEQFLGSLNLIDYEVKSVSEDSTRLKVELTRQGSFPMPVDVEITLKNGEKQQFTIPLDLMRGAKPMDEYGAAITALPDWAWVETTYIHTFDIPYADVKLVTIDAHERTADTYRDNNSRKAK